LLVIVTVAEICFEGSATLCAVSVTLAGDGRIPGAVNRPLESTVPQAVGHAPPDKLQRTVVSGCPLLVTLTWKACVAPSSTLAGFGVSASVMSLVTVTLADPDFVASALLVAVICTAAGAGRSAGAV
jgi:3-mercaptopyruvate sulfurtransferase SseA